MGSVIQINVNPMGGVPKRRIAETFLRTGGVHGDKQNHLRFHGGPLRAVCLYSFERILALQAEGHPIAPGTVGENLTVQGVDWDALTEGARLRIGDADAAVLEITSCAAPCRQIAGSFAGGDFNRISAKRHPGWSRLYAKVITEGLVREGDTVVTLQGQVRL